MGRWAAILVMSVTLAAAALAAEEAPATTATVLSTDVTADLPIPVRGAVVTIESATDLCRPVEISFQGTGFIVAPGRIVTCLHVLRSMGRANVVTANGKTYPVLGITAEDERSDIAILAADIPAEETAALVFAGAEPEAGSDVTVMQPAGRARFAAGRRTVNGSFGAPGCGPVLNVSGAAAPGSSGGPVTNGAGEVVGIVEGVWRRAGKDFTIVIPASRAAAMSEHAIVTLADWHRRELERDQSVWQTFLDGNNYMQWGDAQGALECFKKVVKAEPQNAEARYHLAAAYAQLSLSDQAVEAARSALRLDAGLVDAYVTLSVAYSATGDRAQAAGALEEALRLEPDYPEAWYRLATIRTSMGQYDAAVDAARRAIALDARYAPAHAALGSAEYSTCEYEKALKHYMDALKLEPANAAFKGNVARAYAALGRDKEAVDAYRGAVLLDPGFAGGYEGIARIYARAGDMEGAATAFEGIAKTVTGSPYPLFWLGWSRVRAGQYAEAVAPLSASLKLDPSRQGGHILLGRAYLETERSEEAAAEFREALRLGADAAGHAGLGSALRGLGRFDESASELEEAVRLDSRTAEYHYELALTYLKLGKRDLAEKEYETLKGLDKETAEKLFKEMNPQ